MGEEGCCIGIVVTPNECEIDEGVLGLPGFELGSEIGAIEVEQGLHEGGFYFRDGEADVFGDGAGLFVGGGERRSTQALGFFPEQAVDDGPDGDGGARKEEKGEG